MQAIYTRLVQKLHDEGMDEPCVFGCGPENARIVLVGEAPGKDEVKVGRPFVGKAGKNLDAFLEMTGICRDELFITNVVKFRPYKVSAKGTVSNRPPTRKEIALCADCLREELAAIRPKVVVTLGGTALRAILGEGQVIGSCHGRPVHLADYSVFPLYHPASVIYRRELTAVYEEDLRALGAWLKTVKM
ncbi:MAG: uracil-DNA glycosylase [Christensenellaceae bacterium]|nr:uracil-DNA glycosylase [Christensenellaceae bacterium]